MFEKRESYHNYMKRKLKEMWDKEEKDKILYGTNSVGKQENLLNYEIPQLRAKIATLTQEVELLKTDNAELTKCYYDILRKLDNARRS